MFYEDKIVLKASLLLKFSAMFIYYSESEECEFLLLYYLLTYFKREVAIPLHGPHLFLEWGVESGISPSMRGVGSGNPFPPLPFLLFFIKFNITIFNKMK